MPNKSIKNKTKISTILIIKINMCKKRVPFIKHTLKSLNNIFEEIVVSKSQNERVAFVINCCNYRKQK